MTYHRLLDGDDLHSLQRWEFANDTERFSVSGLTSSDVGKVARQVDNNSFWILTANSPANWELLTLNTHDNTYHDADYATQTWVENNYNNYSHPTYHLDSEILNTSIVEGATISGAINNMYNEMPKLDEANTWTMAQRVLVNSSEPSSSEIVLDFNQQYFDITLNASKVLSNPTNLQVGQSGVIILRQNATGGNTLTYGGYWKFPNGGLAPSFETTPNIVNALSYYVMTSASILATPIKDIK